MTILHIFFGILFSLLINVTHAANSKQTYYREYWNPTFKGKRVDYCTRDHKTCGKALANQYCRLMGYDQSTKSRIAYNIGVTNYFGECVGCKGWNCNGFSLIRCTAQTLHKPPRDYYYRTKIFVYPRMNHYRVDWCYQNGKQCGHRVAYSFCRRMGFEREKGFEKEEHISATKALSNQRLCFGPQCNAFRSITCYR